MLTRLVLLFVLTAIWANAAVAQHELNEAAIVQKIELLGGTVMRDETLPGRPIVGVSSSGSHRFSDKHLHLLKGLKSLKTLDLRGATITGGGLEVLADLNGITTLGLSGTQVLDADMIAVIQLKDLTSLNLRDTAITGRGMIALKSLNNLTALDLSDTQVGDAGMRAVCELTPLTTLSLRGSKITGNGMGELVHLENLTTLDLGNAQVWDVGLKSFRPLKKLTSLNLNRTQITDAGLVQRWHPHSPQRTRHPNRPAGCRLFRVKRTTTGSRWSAIEMVCYSLLLVPTTIPKALFGEIVKEALLTSQAALLTSVTNGFHGSPLTVRISTVPTSSTAIRSGVRRRYVG